MRDEFANRVGLVSHPLYALWRWPSPGRSLSDELDRPPVGCRGFDFEKRTRLALPEQARAERFLKTDVRIVELIVFRGCHFRPPKGNDTGALEGRQRPIACLAVFTAR